MIKQKKPPAYSLTPVGRIPPFLLVYRAILAMAIHVLAYAVPLVSLKLWWLAVLPLRITIERVLHVLASLRRFRVVSP